MIRLQLIRLYILSLLLMLGVVSSISAQKVVVKKEYHPFTYPTIEKQVYSTENTVQTKFFPSAIQTPDLSKAKYDFQAVQLNEKRPSWIEFNISINETNKEEVIMKVFNQLRDDYPSPDLKFTKWSKVEEVVDDLGFSHISMMQTYKDVPVYNNECTIHSNGTHLYLWNGVWTTLDQDIDVNPKISEREAFAKVKSWYQKEYQRDFTELRADLLRFLPEGVNQGKRVVYSLNGKTHLIWKFTAMPDLMSRYEVFIDAHSGKVIDQFKSSCNIHDEISCSHNHKACTPPNRTSGRDLNNINRNLETFNTGGRNYLIDASRSMFNNSASSIPNDPKGAIWTLDALNTYPNNSFNYDQITTTSSSWSNKKGVSAHYNAGKAYEYYRNTFNRNSIDGRGGNIVSFINVSDENGRDFDNAFWTGTAMFYGNGDVGFSSPLARSLDVAGHEMTHGVVQNSANLEYRNESGALNESFADVFGVMIEGDPNDWRLGEEVVNSSVFRSGALRDMSNPHNGGFSRSDNGYQPAHYNERYRGSDDRGGVHANSGIPNFAFFKIASSMGRDKAQRIFYRALTIGYLTKSSQFIDFRRAIAKAAKDLYGSNEESVCHQKCDEVGIPGSPGGSGNNTDYENDLPLNPGEEFLIATDVNQNNLYLLDATNITQISSVGPESKPSITDNGREVVYVNDQDQVNYLFLNYVTGEVDEITLITSREWQFASISKDGSKFAGVRNVEENKIFVYDFVSRRWGDFELFNPSYTDGVSTGEVKYADVLEWDYSGEYLMYDAYNELRSSNGQNINYWDIGFVKVWDKDRNDFADGRDISKLFPSLEEDLNVGNPTFSKNSPYIIALDLINASNNDHFLVGANLESSESNAIVQGDKLFYPNFGLEDKFIYFDSRGTGGESYRVAAIELASDKITPRGSVRTSVNAARWGVILGNGERDITDVKELIHNDFNIFPNPASSTINIETSHEANVSIVDWTGRLMFQPYSLSNGARVLKINVENWSAGSYFVKMQTESGVVSKLFIVQ